MTPTELIREAHAIRKIFEPAFSPETAAPGFQGSVRSSGHCAIVAAILFQRLGGKLVSTTVDGQSHWFNRLPTTSGWMDVDLTGDQFGRPVVNVETADELYPDTRVREVVELNDETLARARLLAKKARLRFDPHLCACST